MFYIICFHRIIIFAIASEIISYIILLFSQLFIISNEIIIFFLLLWHSHFIALSLLRHKLQLFNAIKTLRHSSLPKRTLCLTLLQPYVSLAASVYCPCRCFHSGIANRVAPNNLVTAFATPPRILGSSLAHVLAPNLHHCP